MTDGLGGVIDSSLGRLLGRWHEQDFNAGVNGASTTPDETDFYFYSSDNQLEKAIYNVTSDTNGAQLNLASINWTNVDANNVTATDRVIYGRRVTGTRQRVNWYRGSPSRTSALPGSFDESTTGPTQKTHYDVSVRGKTG